jgi:hypothetical protein
MRAAMSKKPSDTPPERSLAPRPVQSAMLRPDTDLVPATAALETSYSRKLVKYAWHETREHKKVELIASCVGGVVGGIAAISLVGFTWAGVVAAFVGGFVGLVAALVCIFLFNLIYSPKALDEKQRLEIADLNTSKDELESKLAAREESHFEWGETLRELHQQHIDDTNTLHRRDISTLKTDYENEIAALKSSHKSQLEDLKQLRLVINTNRQSEVRAEQDNDGSLITVFLKLHVENHALTPVPVRKLETSLYRQTKRGVEKEMLRSKSILISLSGSEELANHDVLPGRVTEPRWFQSVIGVSPRYWKLLNRTCFLRVTMEAMRQPQYSVDLVVDWEAVRRYGTTFVTPRK